jgi:hypothetical protein
MTSALGRGPGIGDTVGAMTGASSDRVQLGRDDLHPVA